MVNISSCYERTVEVSYIMTKLLYNMYILYVSVLFVSLCCCCCFLFVFLLLLCFVLFSFSFLFVLFSVICLLHCIPKAYIHLCFYINCFHMLLLVLYQVLLLIAFVRLRSPFFILLKVCTPQICFFILLKFKYKHVILVIVKMSSSYL